MGTRGYTDLIVWQKGIFLTVLVYRLTEKFPAEEKFGLVSQMRRAAVSISSNIAEGSKRRSRKDFMHFLSIALGSGAELETHIETSKQLFPKRHDYSKIDSVLDECMRILHTMIKNMD